jgi:hypothetical protein
MTSSFSAKALNEVLNDPSNGNPVLLGHFILIAPFCHSEPTVEVSAELPKAAKLGKSDHLDASPLSESKSITRLMRLRVSEFMAGINWRRLPCHK